MSAKTENNGLTMTTKQQERVVKVLENMKALAQGDDDDAAMLAEALEEVLNELSGEDAFGTEAQNDPRGDFRDGVWSMTRVQGVDD